MYIVLGLIALVVVAIFWLPFRIAVTHPISDVSYGFLDLVMYFRHKMYNWYEAENRDCYGTSRRSGFIDLR